MADSVYLTNPFGGGGGSGGITIGTSTITGGTTTRILYDNAGVVGEYTLTGTGTVAVMATAPTLTGPVTLTEAVGSSGLTITGATQTASFPALNITQTWNNAGVTFTGANVNVTDTASAAASLLQAWQVAGTTKAAITKAGQIQATGGATATAIGIRVGTGNTGLYDRTASQLSFSSNGIWQCSMTSSGAIFNQNYPIGFDTEGQTGTLTIYRDASDILAQRRTTNAQTFRLYNTYTDASNYERLGLTWATNVIRIGAANAGTGTARVMTLDYGGTTTAAVSIPITSGQITLGGGITTPGGTLHTTNTALTDGAGASAGTLTNAPAAGNPTKWIPINDNGTTRYIPAW